MVDGTANNGRFEILIDHNVTSGGSEEEQLLVSLTPSCDLSGTTEQPRDASGVRYYKRLSISGDHVVATWVDAFDGGCAAATTRTTPSLAEALEAESKLTWTYNSRAEIADVLGERSSGKLQLHPAA